MRQRELRPAMLRRPDQALKLRRKKYDPKATGTAAEGTMDLAATSRNSPTGACRWLSFVLDLDAGELRTANGRLADLRRQALEVLLVLGPTPATSSARTTDEPRLAVGRRRRRLARAGDRGHPAACSATANTGWCRTCRAAATCWWCPKAARRRGAGARCGFRAGRGTASAAASGRPRPQRRRRCHRAGAGSPSAWRSCSSRPSPAASR